MPLYDFKCRNCNQEFEALVRHDNGPACPSCHSTEIERQLSPFAVSSDGTKQRNLQQARKQGTKRAMEKAKADQEFEQHHDD